MTLLLTTLALALPLTHTVSATAYDPCSAGTRMADGHTVHVGAVADNALPLGTHIRLRRGIRALGGRRRFTVEDRGGPQMQLDIWMPDCHSAIEFGRRLVSFVVVR